MGIGLKYLNYFHYLDGMGYLIFVVKVLPRDTRTTSNFVLSSSSFYSEICAPF